MKDPENTSFAHRLPGDISFEEYVRQTIRVNHAGEYGAIRIYQGQYDVLKKRDPKAAALAKEMGAHEQEHLDYFSEALVKRGVRPTALHPFWHAAGYALGAATALMGKNAAMACTVAVEEAIDEHYQGQIDALKDSDEKELTEKIVKFREDELHHRDIGYDNGAADAPCFAIMSKAIKSAAKLAIETAKRI